MRQSIYIWKWGREVGWWHRGRDFSLRWMVEEGIQFSVSEVSLTKGARSEMLLSDPLGFLVMGKQCVLLK